MEQRDNHYLIPQHERGLKKDLESSVTADTQEDAEDWFVAAKERLLHVNDWKNCCANFGAAFAIAGSNGKETDRTAHTGDFIKVDIPGDAAGKEHEWMHIEAIEYDDYPDISTETIAMRMRPCKDPQNRDEHTAPVFNNEATGTLVIERQGKTLRATYHCRNGENSDGGQWQEAVAAVALNILAIRI